MLGLSALTKAIDVATAEAAEDKLNRRDLAIAMRLYANDLEDNPEAYKNWCEIVDNQKVYLTDHPVFVPGRYYLRKTVKCQLGTRVFLAEPYVNPRLGDKMWVADPSEASCYISITWTGSAYEKRLLEGGLVHSSLKRASEHGEALYEFGAAFMKENVQRAVSTQ